MRETGRIVLEVGHSVLSQHSRRVVIRIEADREQMRFVQVVRVPGEVFMDLRKRGAQPRTERGEWTTRINKGDKYGLSLQIRKVKLLAILVDQLEIRDVLAGFHLFWRSTARSCAGVRNPDAIPPEGAAVY